MACVDGAGGGTAGLQAEMTPSSPAKINAAGPVSCPSFTLKSSPSLNTMPVGSPASLDPAGPGIETTSVCLPPSPSYSVDLPVWLSATHTKPLGLKATPQEFARSASV